MKHTVLLVLWAAATLTAFAQTSETGQRPYIFLKRTVDPIRIDGKLEEKSWFTGTPAKDFWLNFPNDSIPADPQTEIYMTFDDKFLYVAAICYSKGNQYVIPSLRRDYRASGNDNITFVFDTFKDRTNAFVFGMNPYGVNREALIANGGREPGDFNENWDNKWIGESFIGEGFWSCELAIPFTTLRYNEGQQEWNFNCYRFDMQSNTRSTWNRIPQNQIIMSLAYMSNMVWEESPKKNGANIALIPYLTGGLSKNFRNQTPTKITSNIGGDAKLAVTPSLNLDLTFNPDFSQVEVDQQVINLDRFEIFFPERRQFFLENADLFGSFGNPRINPFFSRRIGIARNDNGTLLQVPILYGARLSGKLDNNWRLGLLNMHTLQDVDNGIPHANYAVVALQRKVFSRSNIGLIAVNKESFSTAEGIDVSSPYNRVFGLDYNLASSDNRWNGKFFYHQNFSADQEYAFFEKFAHGASLEFRERDFAISMGQQWVKKGYVPEVGFTPRNDFYQISPEFTWFFYPKQQTWINQHNLGISTNLLWKPGYGNTDRETRLSWNANLVNTGDLNLSLVQNYIYLFDAFDPSRTGATPLAADTDYRFFNLTGFYSSDRRKIVSYSLRPNIGQFFNGMRYSISGGLNVRYQPYGFIEMNVNYSYIDLPAPYAQARLLLIGPRIDFTFNRNVFFTTFIQYNSQIENININARLQWRFAPVSDFFLVFTDNYDASGLAVKNRAVVAKLTYWLNI